MKELIDELVKLEEWCFENSNVILKKAGLSEDFKLSSVSFDPAQVKVDAVEYYGKHVTSTFSISELFDAINGD